jgi:hypothetical protein
MSELLPILRTSIQNFGKYMSDVENKITLEDVCSQEKTSILTAQ